MAHPRRAARAPLKGARPTDRRSRIGGLSWLGIGTCTALACLAAPLALAQDEGLSLSAAYRVQRDSNLFRLADGVNPLFALGRTSAAETLHIRSVGLHYARDFSLQRLEADIGLVDYAYDTYDQLDLLARNHDLRWRWAITPDLTGTVRTQRDESVNSFEDTSVLTQRNRRLRRFESVDANWRLDGAWTLIAEAQEARNENQQPLVGEDSQVLRTTGLGVRRETPKGSSLALRWRSGEGEIIDPDRAPAPLRDDDFRQDEWALDARWPVTDKTRLEANLAWIDREHERVAARDYDALNWRVSANWTPSAKTLLRLSASEDFSSYQTSNASVTRTRRWTLNGTWVLTSKWSLQGSWGSADRDFQRPPPGALPDPRKDRTRERSLSLRWAFARQASLDLTWQDSRRQSNVPSWRYRSDLLRVGISGRF
ncbi:MAG: TonB-dependent receptor [Hydrogenophaga sp.]|uniref:XrtB/PEP-CTERM-associated polysaccharide biosynthesis outer membrane protein EpsL n=1 Tax=Hydrogenophaga sp. TaxID=1904254 RepID=UPI0016913D5B|nr:XrtB/PEP-CTERM-associated polysaccharide biosynthesis outer membrane protein EpsL [Hydrogenophaga sp.]NIM40966.1 TonB-dependent receptor [Hydrogenophaga sp.]NIN26324.1 TonB-dependent receptor [Hydrogenophaga sp.]NIN31199.1 TonB-dependent receptor [Hydrogenophaga sp.]NIN55238.1 TonB-dependent receptor [Hydrogenophaga sp.]NIO53622.1 TonB-dependent receptor [Hydrogenophaga sp.]